MGLRNLKCVFIFLLILGQRSALGEKDGWVVITKLRKPIEGIWWEINPLTVLRTEDKATASLKGIYNHPKGKLFLNGVPVLTSSNGTFELKFPLTGVTTQADLSAVLASGEVQDNSISVVFPSWGFPITNPPEKPSNKEPSPKISKAEVLKEEKKEKNQRETASVPPEAQTKLEEEAPDPDPIKSPYTQFQFLAIADVANSLVSPQLSWNPLWKIKGSLRLVSHLGISFSDPSPSPNNLILDTLFHLSILPYQPLLPKTRIEIGGGLQTWVQGRQNTFWIIGIAVSQELPFSLLGFNGISAGYYVYTHKTGDAQIRIAFHFTF